MFNAHRKTVLNVMLALAFMLVMSACGKNEETKAPPPAAPAAPAPAPQAAPAAAPGTATAPAPAAPSAIVLATADGESPNVRVEVQELKRSSGTVLLRFALINDGNEKFQVYDRFGGPNAYGAGTVNYVNLVDTTNKKKYLVVTDSGSKCVCSDELPHDINPKSRMNLWAKFPAPPDDVKKISVTIPHFSPMDDLPING